VNRRAFLSAMPLAMLAMPLAADAQQAGKVYRIGLLSTYETTGAWEPFLQGLRELGWAEGKNIVTERRFSEGKQERWRDLAAELVRLNVDVIVTLRTPATLAAKNATTTIPIVMAAVGDPVGAGLVGSLARPGGNITGLSLLNPATAGKRVELLKASVPGATRLAVLGLRDPANPWTELMVREIEGAARTLGMQLQRVEVEGPTDFEAAFGAATRGRAAALLVLEDALMSAHTPAIVGLAAKNRLPAAYGLRQFVDAGGLMSYGANAPDLLRRAATYVDKILKGAKPADLPVEQPTKFELVINLKTTKALGLTIPQSVLGRADEIIR
jgi:putative tryptophan/tyrosine transport system substrate-binding protein